MKARQQLRRREREGGFSFAELAFAVLVLVIGSVVLINHLTVNYSETRTQQDRVFAFTKAQAILAEIQAYVDRGAITAAIQLDELDDGVVNRPALTITESSPGVLVLPDHPLSENFQRDGEWVWSRRISVQPFKGLNNRNVRYVTVRIFKKDTRGNEMTLASLSSVVNSVGSAFPTTQVFDVYLLAIENIPGWWVFMEAIVPFVESAITDIESRNPGLELRTHWITKASYGRNEVYQPYVNDTVESDQPITSVYMYPGRMPAGNSSTFYYVPDMMKARLNFDGVEQGGYDSDTNPYPYALADFYNHAMRYPQEKALHDLRVQAVEDREDLIATQIAGGLPTSDELYDMSKEPTLRLFLEELNTSPDDYRHALLINLHGELIPMPSLRNYSDAAKSPRALPEVRVVTHPEQIRTHRDPLGVSTEDVVLRVYAYTTDPEDYMAANAAPHIMPDTHPIALQIMGVDLRDTTTPANLMPGVELQHLPGGVPIGGDDRYYDFGVIPTSNGPAATDEMYYDVSFDNSTPGQEFTLIRLYNTPVTTPLGPSGGGLETDSLDPLVAKRSRLYNLEYIPGSLGTSGTGYDFEDKNLANTGTGPKNTARWRLTLPASLLGTSRWYDASGSTYTPSDDVTLTVRTRIWDPDIPTTYSSISPTPTPLSSGTMYPEPIQPENLSETYTWWADSRDDVPITERSQFQGDPRHNPYKDLLSGEEYGDGYNWFHDSLNDTTLSEVGYTDYPGLDGSKLRDRWNGYIRADVPRYFELLRGGVVSANAIYTTLTGYSYYYMGFGNEIGYDSANGYPSSIPVNEGPWSSAGTSSAWYVNNILWYRTYVVNSDNWMGIPWLGELCPDAVYDSMWMSGGTTPRGNLECAGWASDRFVRAYDNWVYASGSDRLAWGTKMWSARQCTTTPGCTSFFNHYDSSGGTFTHLFSWGTGDLTGPGLDLANNYNYPIPTTATIDRPFSLTASPWMPDEFWSAPYSTNRYSARIIDTYYDHPPSGETGSGLVELQDPTGANSGYIIVNGLASTVLSGSSFIAKYSLLTMVHSFFEAGETGLTNRIKMPPRVEIEDPTEISEIDGTTDLDIQFDIAWVRWDGQPYTSAVAGSFSEAESEIEYVIMYSRDNGMTWQHIGDDSLAEPGEKPPTGSLNLYPDSTSGPETETWPITSAVNFPEGSYLLRVEAYRQNQALHYSQHQVKIFIDR